MSIEVYRKILAASDSDDVNMGRTWYQRAHKKVLDLSLETGYTVNQVAGVVAVLSPLVEWNLNWNSARRMCKTKNLSSLKGIPGFNANRRKARNILANKETVEEYVRGPKVYPFYKSLINPEHETPVVDTQMIAAFYEGIAYRDDLKIVSQSEKRKEPIYAAIRTLAREKGWTVAEMQGVLWITFKRINGKYADQLKLFK